MFRYICIWWALISDGRNAGTHADHTSQHALTKVSANIYQISDFCVPFKNMLTRSHDSIRRENRNKGNRELLSPT